MSPVTACPHPWPWSLQRRQSCPSPVVHPPAPCPSCRHSGAVPVALRHDPQTPQTPTMTSTGSADATVDGVRLSELMEKLPLSRSSVFELIKVLGIKTTGGPGANGKGRAAWVSQADATRLTESAQRVHDKKVRIADLGAGLQRRQTPQTIIRAVSAVAADSTDPGPFLARLKAADKAIRSGLGLTTAETSWILGIKPGAAVVIRGGIQATRTGRNCWRLQSADSPDRGGS